MTQMTAAQESCANTRAKVIDAGFSQHSIASTGVRSRAIFVIFLFKMIRTRSCWPWYCGAKGHGPYGGAHDGHRFKRCAWEYMTQCIFFTKKDMLWRRWKPHMVRAYTVMTHVAFKDRIKACLCAQHASVVGTPSIMSKDTLLLCRHVWPIRARAHCGSLPVR